MRISPPEGASLTSPFCLTPESRRPRTCRYAFVESGDKGHVGRNVLDLAFPRALRFGRLLLPDGLTEQFKRLPVRRGVTLLNQHKAVITFVMASVLQAGPPIPPQLSTRSSGVSPRRPSPDLEGVQSIPQVVLSSARVRLLRPTMLVEGCRVWSSLKGIAHAEAGSEHPADKFFVCFHGPSSSKKMDSMPPGVGPGDTGCHPSTQLCTGRIPLYT